MGLPCSGKTTIARVLVPSLPSPCLSLDGDAVRTGLCSDLGFSLPDRRENLRRVREVAGVVNRQGICVVAANITPYEKDREDIQRVLDRVILVWMDAPTEVCEERDVKGMWEAARRGDLPHFTGVDDPFEKPKGHDLRLTPQDTVSQCVKKIMSALYGRGWA